MVAWPFALIEPLRVAAPLPTPVAALVVTVGGAAEAVLKIPSEPFVVPPVEVATSR